MTTTDNTAETLLNEHDVSRITGLSLASVRRWRLLRQGPKYLKIGAAVRYRREDLDAWLDSRPSGGTNPALSENLNVGPTRAPLATSSRSGGVRNA